MSNIDKIISICRILMEKLDMKDIKIQHQFYIDSIQSFRFTNLSYSYFKIFIILNHISLSQADLCQY